MKIAFNAVACVPIPQLIENVTSARARNLPRPEDKKRPPLAVIGGGPSVAEHLETLKAWPGDLWACGSAFRWAMDNDLDATFFNVDPLPIMLESAKGAKRAILASTSDPGLFDAIPDVQIFDLIASPNYVNFGNTAVTATPCLALEMGYRKVTYFGCESSFNRVTHAYKNEAATGRVNESTRLWVRCGDMTYPTRPDFLLQVEMLAEVIRTCGIVFEERSGGLLSALIKHKDYDIVAVNNTMLDLLDFHQDGILLTKEQAARVLPVVEVMG